MKTFFTIFSGSLLNVVKPTKPRQTILLSQNLYAYTLNNPLKYTDPSGNIGVQNNSDWRQVRVFGSGFNTIVKYANSKGQVLYSYQEEQRSGARKVSNYYIQRNGTFDHFEGKYYLRNGEYVSPERLATLRANSITADAALLGGDIKAIGESAVGYDSITQEDLSYAQMMLVRQEKLGTSVEVKLTLIGLGK